MRFDLDEILCLTGAAVVRWPGPAAGLAPVHDLRRAGPGALFFPMRRGEPPAAALWPALARAGAAGAVLFAGQRPPPPEPYPGLGVLTLPSPPAGYFRLAAAARSRLPGPVVGVTGTAGKSSTKEFLAGLLDGRYRVHATIRSRNRISDCAGLLLGLTGEPGEAAVIEMGLGSPGDIGRMGALARPSAGVITNVSGLEWGAGGWEAVVAEKGQLGLHVPPEGFLAVHAGDPGCALLPRTRYRARIFTFGAGPDADVAYEQVRVDEQGTSLVLRLFGWRLPCRLRAPGAFQAANAAAAALVAHLLGVPAAEIPERLAHVAPLPRRFAVHRFGPGLTVIDDTVHVTSAALLAGLNNAAALAGPRRQVAVLSGVDVPERQVGSQHRLIGQYAVASRFTELVLLADQGTPGLREGALAAGLAPGAIQVVSGAGELTGRLLAHARPDTLIYCKVHRRHRIGPALDAFLAALPAAGFVPLSGAAPGAAAPGAKAVGPGRSRGDSHNV